MNPLCVAIVGAGRIGAWHARYAEREGGRVVAIVDLRNPESWGWRCAHAHVCRDLTECLNEMDVVAVHVCTGVESHAALASMALKHRKHVLVEKPVATSAEETRELVSLAADQGCYLAAVHQFPFQSGYRRIQRHSQCLGRIVRLEFRCRSAGGAGRATDDLRRLLFEILPHAHSVLNPFCGGELTESPIDLARAVDDELELAGRVAQVSWHVEIQLSGRPTRNELFLVGTQGSAYVDFFHGYACFERGGTSRVDKILRPLRQATGQLAAASGNLVRRALQREPAYPGLRPLIGEFYESIRTSRPFPQPAVDLVENAVFVDRVRGLVDKPGQTRVEC